MSPPGRQDYILYAVNIFSVENTLVWRVFLHSYVDAIEYHSLGSGPNLCGMDSL